MEWFRLYYEARTDAKLNALSDAEHRTWFNLLCFAAERDHQNAVIPPMNETLLAVEVARGDIALLQRTVERLEALEIVALQRVTNVTQGVTNVTDSVSLRFIHFRKRQYDKPSDEPEAVSERVKRHRNAKKGTGNSMKRDVTRSNTIEAEAEADTERSTPSVSIETLSASAPSDFAESQSALNGKPTKHLTVQQRIFGALVAELGYGPDGEGERQKWNKAIKVIVGAGKTESDIPLLVGRFEARCGGTLCTPLAIANNIGMLLAPDSARVNTTAKRNGSASRIVDRSVMNGAGDDYSAMIMARQKRDDDAAL